ncbi:lantibiotic dehydratase [Actinoallomurus rhizosphaericola]|uniref:lantibiotic dehydratase n=1 Tax=Actinoallomurus rhizosphaericola TaxID=2952536 RepID=UPI00209221A5|nr:lantibiotic dehydratase [Actinoallomurus rhizosphaericola]
MRLALMAASADLGDALSVGFGGTSRRDEKLASGIARYLVRMSTRSTPFGLFSGIAFGNFDTKTTARLGKSALSRFVTRTDIAWHYAAARRLEQDKDARLELNVIAHPAIYECAGRFILSDNGAGNDEDYKTITARSMPLLAVIFNLSKIPIRKSSLVAAVAERFPKIAIDKIRVVTEQLQDLGFLISDLRPPTMESNLDARLIDRLTKSPPLEAFEASVRRVASLADEIDHMGISCPLETIREFRAAKEVATGDTRTKTSWDVDAILSAETPTLSDQIGTAGAITADLLLRTSGRGNHLAHISRYHSEFIEHFGTYAEVPLLELLSHQYGLGAPDTYLQPPRFNLIQELPTPLRQSKRDAVLYRLITRSISNGFQPVELSDADVASLEESLEPDASSVDQLHPVDLYLEVLSASPEHIDRGDFKVSVGPAAARAKGGRTFGRFHDLFTKEQQDQLQKLLGAEEDVYPDGLFAEVSYLAKTPRAANVARRPKSRRYEILFNTAPSLPLDRVIYPSDLLIGASPTDFYIRSRKLGKEIIATQSHLLSPIQAPNPARFLLEVSSLKAAAPNIFSWGTFESMPYLPRIQRGNIILCAAQWRLSAEDLKLDVKDWQNHFVRAVSAWRKRSGAPRYVYIVEADNRLLIDLEHPASLVTLQRELQKIPAGHGQHQTAILHEAFVGESSLWLHDESKRAYFSEVVVPLLPSGSEPSRGSESHILPGRRRDSFPVPRDVRCALPGGTWNYAKLYAEPSQHDSLISGPIADLNEELRSVDKLDQWFFIRYADPLPHIRLRFKSPTTEDAQQVLLRMLKWATGLVGSSLIKDFSIATYVREIERYGGVESMGEIETVFGADSSYSCKLLRALSSGAVTLDVDALMAFSIDRIYTAWGFSLDERFEAAKKFAGKTDFIEEFRPVRQVVSSLISPWQYGRSAFPEAERSLLVDIGRHREEVMSSVAGRITSLEESRALTVPQSSLLASLGHMHVNRVLGIDRDRERKILAFWRHALQMIKLRPTVKTE